MNNVPSDPFFWHLVRSWSNQTHTHIDIFSCNHCMPHGIETRGAISIPVNRGFRGKLDTADDVRARAEALT